MKTVMYKQCKLVRQHEHSSEEVVTWIPERYAEAGKVVKLREDSGEWSDGWVVKHVSPLALDEHYVVTKLSRAHLKQREHSDI